MFGYLKDLGRYLVKSVPGLNFLEDGIDLLFTDIESDSNYQYARAYTNLGKLIIDFPQFFCLLYGLFYEPSTLPEVFHRSLYLSIPSTIAQGAIEQYFKRGESK